MVATVAGIHLGIDIHANRPAGNAQPDGSFYSCSTHSLIYKSNFAGNSWATWATLGTGFANPMTTAGDTIYGGASGVATRLAGGTSGYVLTSNGATSAPSWQAAAGGGGGGSKVWLARQTASTSATLDFTAFISGTYEVYEFEFVNIIAATDGAAFLMRMGTGGGPTYDTGANYHYHQWRYFASSQGAAGADGQTAINLQVGIDTGAGANYSLNGDLKLYHPGSAIYKAVLGQNVCVDNGANAFLGTKSDGLYLSTTAVTAVRFLMSTGNITSGAIDVYGITHA